MSYGPDPLINACRVEFTKSWNAPTCNTNKLIYTPDNEVHKVILNNSNTNGADECCLAAFEEQGDMSVEDRDLLLTACD